MSTSKSEAPCPYPQSAVVVEGEHVDVGGRQPVVVGGVGQDGAVVREVIRTQPETHGQGVQPRHRPQKNIVRRRRAVEYKVEVRRDDYSRTQAEVKGCVI